MKNKKHFYKVVSLCICIALFAAIVLPLSLSADSLELDDGFVSIEDFGATRDDNTDDYAAFKKALETGKNIYIPQGKFVVSKPIVVEDITVKGAGSAVSQIQGKFDDKSQPIMIVKGKSTVTDIYFLYKNTDINSDEVSAERVGLQIGDKERGLEAGSEIRNLFFDMVGTAIYCPPDSSCNGVLFETLEVQHYTYRGVDMQCMNRINNTYSNIYVNDQAYFKCLNAGFALEGSEYGAVLNQINIEHASLLHGMILRNVKNFNIGAIHFEGLAISQDDMGMIYAENSSGYIGNITYILNFVRCYNSSVIRMGESKDTDIIKIGNINLRGVNQPDQNLISAIDDWMEELGSLSNRGLNTPQAKTFVVFERDPSVNGEYKIVYDNYSFYTYWENEYDFWNSLPTRGNIVVTKSESYEVEVQ